MTDNSLDLTESDLEKRIEICDEVIQKLRDIVNGEFVQTVPLSNGAMGSREPSAQEVAKAADILMKAIDLKGKYVLIKHGDRDMLRRRLERSLEPGGKLFRELVQKGWSPPRPSVVKARGQT